jgi:hypothetical protein
MRSFTPPAETRFYAGVDLHARALFLVVLGRDGRVVYARNLPAAPEPLLRAVPPLRDGLLVACACMHCWYWLADTCREEKIAFVLGHAWAMKAVQADWRQDQPPGGAGQVRLLLADSRVAWQQSDQGSPSGRERMTSPPVWFRGLPPLRTGDAERVVAAGSSSGKNRRVSPHP